MLSILQSAIQDAAFWVSLTFGTVIIWLVLQGYWTRWAHRRIDTLKLQTERQLNELRAELHETTKQTNRLTAASDMPWLKTAKR